MKNNKTSAIILAAGKGERAGFGKNKLLAPLYGAPALYHTLEKFNIKEIDEVLVTASKQDFEEIKALCKPFGYTVVAGGATRTQSVKNALEKVTGNIVIIHDGARPFLSRELIFKCIEDAKKFGSAVCAVKFTDTAVCAENGVITARTERDSLYRVQTPQAFRTDEIKKAYSLSGGEAFTDDSAVYGKFIKPPHVTEGEESNIKLTFKEDFQRGMPKITAVGCGRVGFGVDTHAFGEGNFITLAGVKIPHTAGLTAHSDGDVIYHALIDAYLSAAGLKDIGTYFPDTSEETLGADSGKMLEKVINMPETSAYRAGNISITVQAEAPRLSPYIDKMRKNISRVCGINIENVAVSAGTCEHLGFVGKGLGITAYCAALLQNKEREHK